MKNKMEIFTKFLAYFIIYSLFGWILESIYKTIYEKKIVNSGFLYGPLCPIYGIGALIMYLVLDRYKKNIFFVFALGFIILSIWEYIVGFLLEKIFKTKYWDYSEKKFNIQGRVCLINSVFWGTLGVIFIYYIHPQISKIVEQIPIKVLYYTTYGTIIYIIIDLVFSIINLNDLSKKVDKIKEIGESIKLKLSEIKKLANAPIKIKAIEQIILDLKKQEETLRENLTKKTNDLKRKFPTMKSEKLSEFFNHKKR